MTVRISIVVVGIYLILFALAFWNIHRYNNQLTAYNTVMQEHQNVTKLKAKTIIEKLLEDDDLDYQTKNDCERYLSIINHSI